MSIEKAAVALLKIAAEEETNKPVIPTTEAEDITASKGTERWAKLLKDQIVVKEDKPKAVEVASATETLNPDNNTNKVK